MKPVIKQHKSGLTSVLFNTTDKWMEYCVYYGGNSEGITSIHCDTYDNDRLVDRYEINLPTSCRQCVKYIQQEKDQIEVLFVPRNMLS